MIDLTKNDLCWQNIFDKYAIIDTVANHGKFEISATKINEFREARLMTKFDNQSNLPQIFTAHKLSILPITRGSYLIAPFETYHQFPVNENDKSEIKYIEFPDYIESITPKTLTSEATAINCAYLSGMIADFVEDDGLRPTVSGRMTSNEFSFDINNLSIKKQMSLNVKNSQIEIDGGYEGFETLSLLEAKNSISKDFLIRQLYYPFRRWHGQVSKRIKTIFLVYTNNVFYLYEYTFKEINNYNSLVLSKFRKYSFERVNIELVDIQNLLTSVVETTEPKIPFPQADNFARVINLCELLLNGNMTKEDISVNYDFTKRQADYYSNAGKYLGLLHQTENEISLSSEGIKILNLPNKTKQLEFVKLIIQHTAFKDTLVRYLKNATRPTEQEIIEIMKKCNLHKVSTDNTYKRRSSTVISWVNWILDLPHSSNK